MEGTDWLELCYRALGVPADLPDQDRRRLAEHALLEKTSQQVDILGIGSAEAAIDLLVRYGEAGELGQVMMRWEQAEYLEPELRGMGDEGTRRATLCAKQLLGDVVRFIERSSATGEDV
ncbi:MAG TPA: hypothetical protein VMZ51_05130 [Acidimicrobiales bacterium]|nr:hypothetical protein [Acidimicrobiales bacterium]